MSKEISLPKGNQPDLETKQQNCSHIWTKQNGFRFDYMYCLSCGKKKDLAGDKE